MGGGSKLLGWCQLLLLLLLLSWLTICRHIAVLSSPGAAVMTWPEPESPRAVVAVAGGDLAEQASSCPRRLLISAS